MAAFVSENEKKIDARYITILNITIDPLCKILSVWLHVKPANVFYYYFSLQIYRRETVKSGYIFGP